MAVRPVGVRMQVAAQVARGDERRQPPSRPLDLALVLRSSGGIHGSPTVA